MESEFEPPVCIEQASETDIEVLICALDEAAKKGHLRPRLREGVLHNIQQYYKLRIWDILCGCFQLIPWNEEAAGIDYIELWAVVRYLPEHLDTKANRNSLIQEMIRKAQEIAKSKSRNLISITSHENLKARFEIYWAQEAGGKYTERQSKSPHKTLFEFPVN